MNSYRLHRLEKIIDGIVGKPGGGIFVITDTSCIDDGDGKLFIVRTVFDEQLNQPEQAPEQVVASTPLKTGEVVPVQSEASYQLDDKGNLKEARRLWELI